MASITARRASNTSPKTSDTDSAILALLGKKEVLKRRFGFTSIFAFAICELITWETVLALFSQGLNNGGPAGLVYGFLIAWLSTLSVYIVIAELASMAPIAGGQYYWVYMLAPQRWKKFSSYVIGWLTSLAWIATVATETIFAGTIIQGLIVLDYPEYEGKKWQGTLLAWLVIAVAVSINVVIPGMLPIFNKFIFVFHLPVFVLRTVVRSPMENRRVSIMAKPRRPLRIMLPQMARGMLIAAFETRDSRLATKYHQKK